MAVSTEGMATAVAAPEARAAELAERVAALTVEALWGAVLTEVEMARDLEPVGKPEVDSLAVDSPAARWAAAVDFAAEAKGRVEVVMG